MAAEDAGALRVSISANIASLEEGLRRAGEKTKAAARALGDSFTGSADAARRMGDRIGESFGTVEKEVQGARKALPALGQAFNAIGVQAGPQIAGLTNSLAGLTTGMGLAGAATVALGAVIFAATQTIQAFSAESKKAGDGAVEWSKTIMSLGDAGKAAEALRAADRARAAGVSTDVLAVQDAIEQTKALYDAAKNTEDRLVAERIRRSRIQQDLDFEDEEALKKAQAARQAAYDQQQNLERDLARIQQEEAKKRTATTEKEAADRAAAVAKSVAAAREQAQAFADAVGDIRAGGTPMEQELRGLDRRRTREVGAVNVDGSLTSDQAAEKRLAILERFNVEEQAIRARYAAAEQQRTDELLRQATEFEAKRAELSLDAYTRELAQAEREKAAAIEAATARGENVFAVETYWNERLLLMRAEHDQEVAEATAAQSAEQLAARQEAARRVAELEGNLQFELTQFGKDESQQRIDAYRREMEAVIAEAEKAGARVEALRALVAQRIAQMQAAAAPTSGGAPEAATGAASDDPEERFRKEQEQLIKTGSLLDGFQASMRLTQHNLQSIGQTGAAIASSLASGFGNAFAAFATGAASAKDAFKAFASQFLTQIVAMIAQQAALAVLTSITTFGASATTGTAAVAGIGPAIASLVGMIGNATPAATGGSFRVGGISGIDTHMVTMALTPGELVEVTPRGEVGGGGAPAGTVRVTVNNYSGAKVDARSFERPDGTEIVVTVGEALAEDARMRGPGSQALEELYGLTRVRRRV